MRKALPFFVLFLALGACGKKLPIPPPSLPPPPGQTDTTRIVLAEIFSTRLCTNCPRADSALHALSGNYGPNRIVALEYHPQIYAGSRDSLGTPETDSRITYFGVVNYPTCLFGGLHYTLGAPLNVYEVYEDSFAIEQAKRSPVSLGLTATQSGVATVQVKALTTVPSALVLHTVVAEDSIYYRGPYQNWWRFVVRDMIPDANGETLQLAAGDSLSLTKGFTIQPGWNANRVYLFAFVQNPANKEILQAVRIKLLP